MRDSTTQEGWQEDSGPKPARPTHYPTFRTATRSVVASRRLAAQQQSLMQPRLSDAEQSREDRRQRMVERFRLLEQRAQEDQERAEQSVGKRAHSASAAPESPRRPNGGRSYLFHQPGPSIARSKRRTHRLASAPMAHMRALDLKPLGASQASIAELKVSRESPVPNPSAHPLLSLRLTLSLALALSLTLTNPNQR